MNFNSDFSNQTQEVISPRKNEIMHYSPIWRIQDNAKLYDGTFDENN